MKTSSSKNLDPRHVQWCRQLFERMPDRGFWAIPRCGIVYQKVGDELVLTERLDYQPNPMFTAEEFADAQMTDIVLTRKHFEAAKITVKDLQ